MKLTKLVKGQQDKVLELGRILADEYRQEAFDSGVKLSELGWGLDSPAQIKAAKSKNPSAKQTALLVDARLESAHSSGLGLDEISGGELIVELFPEKVAEWHMGGVGGENVNAHDFMVTVTEWRKDDERRIERGIDKISAKYGLSTEVKTGNGTGEWIICANTDFGYNDLKALLTAKDHADEVNEDGVAIFRGKTKDEAVAACRD